MNVEISEVGIDIAPFMGGIGLSFVRGRNPVNTFQLGPTLANKAAVAIETVESLKIDQFDIEITQEQIRVANFVFIVPQELRPKIASAFRGQCTFSTIRSVDHV